MSDARHDLIARLEAKLRHLTLRLYDTRVPAEEIVGEVLPYLDEQVRFVDPWQSEAGIARYRAGLAGFHNLFKFDFEIVQLNVSLDESGKSGRCIVDGVMHLKQLEPLLIYPLRTILTYAFDVTHPGSENEEPRLKIREHEEMWSYGDMIEAVPLAGRVYAKLFRPAFARGFLAVSRLSSLRRR